MDKFRWSFEPKGNDFIISSTSNSHLLPNKMKFRGNSMDSLFSIYQLQIKNLSGRCRLSDSEKLPPWIPSSQLEKLDTSCHSIDKTYGKIINSTLDQISYCSNIRGDLLNDKSSKLGEILAKYPKSIKIAEDDILMLVFSSDKLITSVLDEFIRKEGLAIKVLVYHDELELLEIKSDKFINKIINGSHEISEYIRSNTSLGLAEVPNEGFFVNLYPSYRRLVNSWLLENPDVYDDLYKQAVNKNIVYESNSLSNVNIARALCDILNSKNSEEYECE